MIDPEILLQSKPVQIESPLDAQTQAQQVSNLRSLGQLQQGQIAMQPGELQAQGLDIQARQLQMQRTQALNEAYRQAYTPPSQAGGAATNSVVKDASGNQLPGAPAYNGSGGASGSSTPGTTPGIDTGKLVSALAMGPAASSIPEILKGVNEFQKSTADLAAANTKAATDQADYAGGVGATLQKAQNDPRLFLVLAQHALDAKAVDPKVVGPLMNEVAQALAQDPSGASATALTKQIADHFVSQSPAQQKLANESMTAQGAAARGTAALQTSNREASQQDFTNAISDLAGRPPKDAAEYQQRVGALLYSTASRILAAVPVASYDPQQSGPVLQKLGMTPDQQVTTGQAAANAAQNAEHQGVEEKQRGQQIGIEASNAATNRGRLTLEQQKQAGAAALNPAQLAIAQKLATGDFNPTLLARFSDKEAIINGAISINPNWTPQAYATKAAFTDPQKQQSKNLGTISRIVGHIGRFEQNSQQMGTAPAYALGVNVTGGQNALNNDAHAISAELEKLVSGGVGTEGQIQAWQKGLHSPMAPARQQSIDEISQLIGSQYEGMNQTYKAATGLDLPVDKYVSPAGQAWMKGKGINVGGGVAAGALPAHGIPDIGSTFNGGKVLKVTRIQ